MLHAAFLLHSLDTEEEGIHHYLQNHIPALAELFLTFLPRGRQGVLHRLIQSIVRENIAGLAERSFIEAQGGRLVISIAQDVRLLIPLGRSFSFGRFDIAGDVEIVNKDKREVICHPAEVLTWLEQYGEEENEGDERQQRWERFRRELSNSAANLALAYAEAELRKRGLLRPQTQEGALGLEDWLRTLRQADERFSTLAYFEQWVIEGHPIHPGAKLRMGMDAEDVIRYCSEFGASVKPVLLAVAKTESQESSLDESTSNELLEKDYPGINAHAQRWLAEQGLDMKNYRLIPVHPWQYEHVIRRMHKSAIQDGTIVLIPDAGIETTALLSLRTLAPLQKSGEGRHHIKTALAIQTTGTMRTISAASGNNGPIVSGLLEDILSKENHFGGTFFIVPERLGVYYDPSDRSLSAFQRAELNKNLITIFRENVESFVADDEIVMPASALLAFSPYSGLTVVEELLDQVLRRGEYACRAEAAVAFVREYAKVALPACLTMFSRYGISLEGHLQNCMPVFKNGLIDRMYMRDFGGVRMLKPRLERQGMLREFHPDSITLTDNERDVRNKLIYPVIQNHFGELLACIARALNMAEERLWIPVAETCREAYRTLKHDDTIREQAERDEIALFADRVELKAMTTMRLLGKITSYTYSEVPNILAAVKNND